MKSHGNVWSNATSERSARNVANRVLRLLGRPIIDPVAFVPYPKTGGWTFSFKVQLSGEKWSDYVVDVIALGQCVGYGWKLSGMVTEGLEGWSNEARISGVTSIQWQIWPEDHQYGTPDGDDTGA